MKVLVTGASGGIGESVCRALLDSRHAVLRLSRRERPGADWVRGDILSPESYISSLDGLDAVVHLAAITHTNDVRLYDRVNAEGAKRLLEACQKAGIRRFIHVSTTAVGAHCGAYGASKAQAEDFVRASSLDWVILRPSEVYGAASGEAVSRVIEDVRTKRFVLYPMGKNTLLAPVHVDDVVKAIVSALTTEHVRETYVLAGHDTLHYSEMVEMAGKAFGRGVLPVPVPLSCVRWGAALFALLGCKKPPVVRDQVPRLCCEKDREIQRSMSKLGFAPRRFGEYLEETASRG